MKLIVDTNVFISGIFFSGPPFMILDAWRRGKVTLVISPEILDEYQRVGERLAEKFAGVNIDDWIELLMLKAILVNALPLPARICDDPDDDKFLACAVAGKTKYICSGDKHLLDVSGYHNINILRPRVFLDKHIGE